jgi:hypothetical protein
VRVLPRQTMRLAVLPILGLTFTFATLSISAPLVEPAAAASFDKRKPDKRKVDHSALDRRAAKNKGSAPRDSMRPAVDASRKATSYRVLLAGATLPGVTVSPLSEEVELVETRRDNRSVQLSPGRVVRGEVTLTGNGPIPLVVLDQWRAVEDGAVRKESVAVRTFDSAGEAIYEHRLIGTFPRKLTTTPDKDKWTLTLAVEAFELFRAP